MNIIVILFILANWFRFIGKNIIVTLIEKPLEQEGRLNKRRKFTTKEQLQ